MITAKISTRSPRLAAAEEPSALISRANGFLELAWGRKWLQRPDLDPPALLAVARRTAGLEKYGDENGWRGRLHDLCAALHDEAKLTPVGITIAYGQIVAALANRLRCAETWRQNPEIAEIPITRPIVVVGQMRSGSTRVQRLLACDERLTYTRFFESWNPLPRWRNAGFDDRIGRGWLALRVASALNPKFAVVHPVRVFDADEEIGLHNISLYGAAFEAQWRIPSFAKAGEANDSRPVYEEFRRFLQTIRWLRKDRVDRPWVLKIPQFGQDLSTVLEVFPDARLIVLERDPVSVVGSSSSLVYNQMTVQSVGVDRSSVGREWLRKTLLRKRRIASALDSLDHSRVEIAYDDIQADWRTEMRRIYSTLELPFTPGLEKRMGRYLQRPTHDKLVNHRYDLAQFGLSEDEVRTAYAGSTHAGQGLTSREAA